MITRQEQGCCDFGEFKCDTIIGCTKDGKQILVDKCIAAEVYALRKLGVETRASCCGHRKIRATVCVSERDLALMELLGYTQ